MIEVKLHRFRRTTHLLYRTSVLAHAIGRGELHHIADLVLLLGVTQFIEQLARHPLQQIGVALAKGLASGQIECGASAFRQTDQALLNRR